jgi:hypothetical protein
LTWGVAGDIESRLLLVAVALPFKAFDPSPAKGKPLDVNEETDGFIIK